MGKRFFSVLVYSSKSKNSVLMATFTKSAYDLKNAKKMVKKLLAKTSGLKNPYIRGSYLRF